MTSQQVVGLQYLSASGAFKHINFILVLGEMLTVFRTIVKAFVTADASEQGARFQAMNVSFVKIQVLQAAVHHVALVAAVLEVVRLSMSEVLFQRREAAARTAVADFPRGGWGAAR